MRIALLALVVAALVVSETSGSTELKLLPAVRTSLSLGSSLLRHLAEIKDHLREDIDRYLVRHIGHPGSYYHAIKRPNWNLPAQFPWVKPSFHGAFSYQASSTGGLPMLPLPFFPKPRPAIMFVPCLNVKTPIAPFVFPCVKARRTKSPPTDSCRGCRRPRRPTERTPPKNRSRVLLRVPSTSRQPKPPSRRRRLPRLTSRRRSTSAHALLTSRRPTRPPEAPTTPASDVTTVTENPDAGVTVEDGSTVEPTHDRKANMIPSHTDYPTTTDGATTEQPPSSTSDTPFNDLLKEAEAAFAKLKEQ
ncbi:hypothetical protein MTO96_006531 [Rhipicephalus appendiculatus]